MSANSEANLKQLISTGPGRRPLPSDQGSLSQSNVHVWAVPLDLPAAARGKLAATLSAFERDRAGRFHSEIHRNRFIVGHGSVRWILSRYLLTAPAGIEFDYGPQGKPSLAGPFAASGFHFNLAHSEELALLAVTRIGSVGVDVERIRPVPEVDALVARFFSSRENAAFQNLPNDQKPTAFFNLWTRKEAWLKATGDGIAHLLNQVEVSFLPGEPARLLRLPAPAQHTQRWVLRELAPASGFAAALAISTPPYPSEVTEFSVLNFEFVTAPSQREFPASFDLPVFGRAMEACDKPELKGMALLK